jgi:hypothetical protein
MSPSQEEIQRDVDEALDAYRSWAIGINLDLTEEEIETKRNELLRSMGGAEIAIPDAGSREIDSWDEVAQLLAEDPEAVVILDDYVKLDDKNQLLNTPFFINRWWFTEGDMTNEQGEPTGFAVMRIIVSRKVHTPTGESDKVIVTDGSTGIYKQLRQITQKKQQTGAMIVRHGLRVSQYTTETAEGIKQAETFYLT